MEVGGGSQKCAMDGDGNEHFPGVGKQVLHWAPRENYPRTHTLDSGRDVIWCSKFDKRGNHLRTDHQGDASAVDEDR